MPKVETTPLTLKPYLFHGVDLTWREGETQATGPCPFCGKAKFAVNIERGVWRCFTCASGNQSGGGNAYTFLRLLHEQSVETSGGEGLARYERLRENRKFLSSNPLVTWGAVPSFVSDEWLLPGYNAEGKIVQLYKLVPEGKSMKWLPTPGLAGHGLHGVNLWDPKKPHVFLCEGPWDGMVLWEVMRQAKEEGNELVLTANEEESLYSSCNVLAVPGCLVMLDNWLNLFADKTVVLLYDNDHPRQYCNHCKKSYSTITHQRCPLCKEYEVKGKLLEPSGLQGMKLAARRMLAHESRPEEIRYLTWGHNGFDPERPHGTDVRDVLSLGKGIAERVHHLHTLLKMSSAIPKEWGNEITPVRKGKAEDAELLPCRKWEELVKAWREAMKWIEGLDRFLSVALACVTSTGQVGDQLWIKGIGPASCGKSTICEALSVNKKYIFAKSTVRGFHSGYKTDQEGSEDHSLIPKIKGRTLVTKDGDTLLSSPNLTQILSEARDLYDSVSRVHYRHGVNRDYQGIRMTWLLCGTSSLRSLDSSELGERFLDCVIMDNIDEGHEMDILWRKAHQADRDTTYLADGKLETQQSPELTRAMLLTGGYINYLRENAHEQLQIIEIDDNRKGQIIALAKFVAYMRARPSKRQEEKEEREMAARLVSQLTRLAKCLAVVLNKHEVDDEVMRRVRRVAMDTARGRTLEIIRELYKTGREGIELPALQRRTTHTEDQTVRLIRFLRALGAVEWHNPQEKILISGRPRWRLSKRMERLYNEVMEHAE